MKKYSPGTKILMAIVILSMITVTAEAVLHVTARPSEKRLAEKRLEAAYTMFDAMKAIKEERIARGLTINYRLDPNGTGMIGDEFTELTTTLGRIEDKRSSANPDFAAMMVNYFDMAGLERGDTVYIGASGSFPGLILAALSAAKAMELHPLVIYSIGASMYGANLPGFTFPEMLVTVSERGILPFSIVAVSAGGHNDRAEGMFFPDARNIIMDIARGYGLPVIDEKGPDKSICRRLEIYAEKGKGQNCGCFVNIGGASANFGDGEDSVEFPNGLVLGVPPLSPGPREGLIFHFARGKIPVIHLLNVRSLSRMNGIPYDPIPFPRPGTSPAFDVGTPK